MSIAAGVKLGPYEVVSLLGAGGIGEAEPLCARERTGNPGARS